MPLTLRLKPGRKGEFLGVSDYLHDRGFVKNRCALPIHPDVGSLVLFFQNSNWMMLMKDGLADRVVLPKGC
jgi:hypothetical protein